MSNARQNLVRRVKALLSKTIENGATEAEAFSALAKAQEMMRAHGLDQDAIEAEAFVNEIYAGRESRKHNWTRHLAGGVSTFTGTFGYHPDCNRNAIQFNGRESDVIFAAWLIDSLDAFVNRQAMAYLSNTGGARVNDAKRTFSGGCVDLFGGALPTVRCSQVSTNWSRDQQMREFATGVCMRITQRLAEMADVDAKRRSQTARAEMERRGMSLKKIERKSVNMTSHTLAGMKAGDGVNFNKPMGGSSARAPLQIAQG